MHLTHFTMSSSHTTTASNINNNLKEKKKKKKKHNKIRKRGYCSSSSSSSFVTRYTFKRAILVGKTRTTTKSPSMTMFQHKNGSFPYYASRVPSKDKELSVSARKLAATLWEINGVEPMKVKKGLRLYTSGSHMLSNPSSEKIKGSEVHSCNRRVAALSFHCSANLMEAGNQPSNKKNCSKCMVGVNNRLKEAISGISTSKKLLKVLNQMCLQEQNSSITPLIFTMSNELDWVRTQIEQLIQEQTSNHNDIESLLKQFTEEKIAWKRREREKIRYAITCIAEELEVEKKLRRQSERLNKNIAKEMENVKASYLKASKELEREKRAKEILQQVCDEIVKGIGEDSKQVEELKKESAKVREEVEMEREMLQFADVLREERVRMKLSEAKYQFEEKNAVLEKVKSELGSFLRTKEEENGGDVDQVFRKLKDLESCLNKTCYGFQNVEKENDLDLEDDDSGESDLQSIGIELNILDNDNKSYKWSYACENVAQDEPKRVSIDKDIGRKSFSERIQWGSICFNKKRDFGLNIKESSDQRAIEFHLGAQVQDIKEEGENYRPMMSLLDCISCSNPPQRSGQSLTLQYIDGEAEENSLPTQRKC
ncbi:PREDICTED: uncharacterized protein LOC109350826 isoform X2 [Lupinus angustifolius]|uniref:uncharacterized protein LOC109350826 isoform X2 n=1 Tax=Lupinus angustifolius TaxID=3871 RepID=UPI00092ECD92|nr:PREDICTED: uncharacterized protein LOC109350826 isoform X2 [Lupinus angustifolius]